MLLDKAADNYHLAVYALTQGWYDAAASRFYYAFHQAGKHHLKRPLSDYNAQAAADLKRQGVTDHYPHKIYVNYCLRDAGYSTKEVPVIIQAEGLRTIGDYYRKQRVSKGDLDEINARAKAILVAQGVTL